MEEEQHMLTDDDAIVSATGISDIYRAAKQLEGTVRKTPLIYSDFFSGISGNTTYLKLENLQTTGAFKLRGAYNKISMLNKEEQARGVITASAGNHAQGVAYASQKLGVKAIICMPATTPILKIEATRALGASVILHGNGFDDAYAHSLRLQKEKGYVYIHPFNDRDVIVGQGTIALELIDALKDVDAILVPVGGGGLASGVALGAKLVNPQVKVIGVEPSTSAVLSGEKPGKHSIQGIGTGFIPKNYDASVVDEIVKISSEEAFEYAKKASHDFGLFVGISSGANIAAAYQVAKKLGKGKIVVTLAPDGGEKYLSVEAFLTK